MKKSFALLLAVLLLLGTLPAGAEPAPANQAAVGDPAPANQAVLDAPEPTEKPPVASQILQDMEPAKAKAAILMDAETGEILYDLNAHAQNYPASMTKVMTALLVLEAVGRGELTLEELEKYSAYTAWIDVCKGWNEVSV